MQTLAPLQGGRPLRPCYSKCGPLTSSITLELVRNANLGPHPDLMNQNLYFNEILGSFPIHVKVSEVRHKGSVAQKRLRVPALGQGWGEGSSVPDLERESGGLTLRFTLWGGGQRK